jgi:hypothetical protein
MEPEHAQVHLLHVLDRAGGYCRAFRSACGVFAEMVEESHATHPHVAREKITCFADFDVPRFVGAIGEFVADARYRVDCIEGR